MGTLSILNVGAGDIKLTFDHANAAEAIRAKRMLTDMIKRGYALLVEVAPGEYQRATRFDPTVGEYLVADFDPNHETEEPFNEPTRPATSEAEPTGDPPAASDDPLARPKKRGRPTTRRIPMERANVVAVGRSAGG